MENYDVVVVGAGLAGLQCSRLLGQRGLRVALIDAKKSVSDRVRTTGIFVRKTLEDFEFPEGSLGPPVRNVTLHSPRGQTIRMESRHDEFRVGQMDAIYREFLEYAIKAGVEWRPGTRLASIEKIPDGCTLRLQSGGREFEMRSRFVVGADGARSVVAREFGLSQNRQWIVGVEEVLEGTPRDGPPEFHCYLDPRIAPGYLAWYVNDGCEAHLGVGGYPSRFQPARALAEFKSLVSSQFDLTKSVVSERRGGLIPVGGVLPKIACDRGLLIGDAAGAVSPLTAGGLDPCLRLSTFAAEVIVRHLSSPGSNALAEYSGNRLRSRFATRRWMRFVFDRVRNPRTLEVLFAAVRGGPLRPIVENVFFGRGSFPDVGPIRQSSETDCVALPG